jgi:transcriptional regulator with XRE-family HTH domain
MDDHIAELLGIDATDPAVQQESEAVDRDMRLVETLVRLRRERGLTQAQVAQLMGRSQPAVSDFERLGGDPHLSTIRRYALAVGAEVHHIVRAADAHAPQPGWHETGEITGCTAVVDDPDDEWPADLGPLDYEAAP